MPIINYDGRVLLWKNANGELAYVSTTESINFTPGTDAVTGATQSAKLAIGGSNYDIYLTDVAGVFAVGSASRTAPSGITAGASVTATSSLQLRVDTKSTYQGVIYEGTYFEVANTSGAKTPVIGGMSMGYTLTLAADKKTYTITMAAGHDLPTEIRSYLITFVNRMGEESAPSIPWEIELNPGMYNAVMNIDVNQYIAFVEGNELYYDRAPSHGIRVYRTATASTGDTEYLYAFTVKTYGDPTVLDGETYLADDTPLDGKWAIVDTIETAALGSACATQDMHRNAEDIQKLQGLQVIHNGMLAAFKENEVWISEPYQPWLFNNGINRSGVHTLPHKVVRIVPVEQGFYALTDTAPYYFSGALPDQMVSQRLTGEFPCLNKRAAAQIGNGVLYISPDGPVNIQGMNAQVDNAIWSRETWRDVYLKYNIDNTISLVNYGHRLVCYFPGSGSGDVRGYVFDMDDNNWSRIDTRIDYAYHAPNGSFGAKTDNIVFGNGNTGMGARWMWFAGDPAGNTKSFWWHSKTFPLPIPTNFGCVQVFGTGSLQIDVYADKELVYTTPTLTLSPSGTIARLPSGFRAARWSFLLRCDANTTVTAYNVATTITELQGV